MAGMELENMAESKKLQIKKKYGVSSLQYNCCTWSVDDDNADLE